MLFSPCLFQLDGVATSRNHAAKTVDLKGNSYRDLMKAPNLIHCWDDVAKVPYMTDNDGNMVCTYEDERSIEYKCLFIKKMHLAGAMYWEYSCDDDSGTLQRAVYDNIMLTHFYAYSTSCKRTVCWCCLPRVFWRYCAMSCRWQRACCRILPLACRVVLFH